MAQASGDPPKYRGKVQPALAKDIKLGLVSDQGFAVIEKFPTPRMIMIILGGLIISLSVGSQVIGIRYPPIYLILGYLILWLAGTSAAYFLIEQIIWPGLSNCLPRLRWIWVLICFFAGLFLVLSIPITPFPKDNQVEITATGQKNARAKGSEVWLRGIMANGKNISTRLEVICDGDWSLIDGSLVSSQNQPSKVDCEVEGDSQIIVRLGKHPWSGKVRLVFGNQVAERDLYIENGGIEEVRFQIPLSRTEKLLRIALFLSDGTTLALILLAVGLWFVNQQTYNASGLHQSPTYWYGYALPIALAWFAYLLAFWPGFISPDSITQLYQVVSGKFYDWHPAFHTMNLWLITRFWFSPAPVVFVQIVILSGLVGWGLSITQKDGAPAWLNWLVVFFMALTPASGLMVLTLWKDIAYAISILALTLLSLKIIMSEGGWIEKRSSFLVLGFVTALASLYRHNGLPVAFGSLIFLTICYRSHLKRFAIAILLALVLWGGVRGPLYRLVDVDTSSSTQGKNQGVNFSILGLVGWHKIAGTQFQPEEQEFLNSFEQLDLNELIPLMSKSENILSELAIRLTLRSPMTTLKFILERRSTFVFQILQPWQNRYEHVDTDIYENPFGFQPDSKIPKLKIALEILSGWTKSPKWDWLFWRNAFWMNLLIFSAVIASLRRHSWKYLLVLVPVLLNALPWAIFTGGQLARYILPTLFVSPMLSGYFLLIEPAFQNKIEM